MNVKSAIEVLNIIIIIILLLINIRTGPRIHIKYMNATDDMEDQNN